MASIANLPTEILISIFQLTAEDSLSTLCTLSIVSQRFYDIIIPILYTSMNLKRKRLEQPSPAASQQQSSDPSNLYNFIPNTVRYDDTILSGLVSLALCDPLPPYVKHLKISGPSISEENTYWEGSPTSNFTLGKRCRNTYGKVFEDSGLKELLSMTKWTPRKEKGRVDDDGGSRSRSSRRGLRLYHARVREDGYVEVQVPGVYDGLDGRVAFRKDFNKLLRLVLRRCEGLKKVKLKDTVEIDDETIQSFSKLPLTHFSITFSSTMAYYWDAGRRLYDEDKELAVDNSTLFRFPGYADLSLLHLLDLSSTLTSLKLFDLFGDIWRYVGEIVDVLIACRHNLTELGLSVSPRKRFQQQSDPLLEYAHDEHEDGYEPIGSTGRDRAFWTKICCRYNRHTRTLRTNGEGEEEEEDLRLKLKYLELGLGGFMFNRGAWPFETEIGEYLSEALDLTQLQTFYWYTMDDFTSQVGPGWDRLRPAVNLKNLMVDELLQPIPAIFRCLKGKLEVIEVTDDIGTMWEEDEEFEELYSILLSPVLKSLKLSPINLQAMKKMAGVCVNLEVLHTRVFAMQWREAIGYFAALPKLRSLDIKLSLGFEEDARTPRDSWETSRINEGLDSVSLIGAVKGCRARGGFRMLEDMSISKENHTNIHIRRNSRDSWETVV